MGGRPASLIIAFCPVGVDLVATLEGIRAETGDAPLIGCTGTAHYTQAETGTAEPTVVVSALGGDGFEVSVSVAENVSAGQRAAGASVAEAALTLTREHQILLLLCDGLAGEQHELVRGAYSVVGASVPLAGGCAADDLSYALTSQFYADEDGVHVLSDAVVAAAISSDAPIGIGIAHGWRKVGDPMLVTNSSGGRVLTLDGEAALDVFLRGIDDVPPDIDDTAEFALFALRHPLGMSRRSGEDIRVIHRGNAEDRSMTCLADVPQGALMWPMQSDQASLLASVDDAYDEAIAALGDQPPVGMLAFDCGVRFLMLGTEGIREEIDLLRKRTGDVPFAGFYTYGEIARSHGSRGMHHMTLVLVAFS